MSGALGSIHSFFTETRANFALFDSVRKMGPVKKGLGSLAPTVGQLFQHAKEPVDHTRLFSAAGLLAGGHKVTQEIIRPKKDKVERYLGVAGGFRTVALATASLAKGLETIHAESYFQNSFVQSAFRSLYMVASPIGTVGAALAGVIFLTGAYGLYKHIKFNGVWNKNNHDVDNRKLIEMAKNLDAREFKAILGEDKEKMMPELEELSQPIHKNQRKYPANKAKVQRRKILLEKLEQKMRSTKKHILSSLGSAATYTLGSWFSIGKIAPMASIVFKNISAAWQLFNNVSQIPIRKGAETIQKSGKRAWTNGKKVWNKVDLPSLKAQRLLQQNFAQIKRDWVQHDKGFRARDAAYAQLIHLIENTPQETIQGTFLVSRSDLVERLKQVPAHADSDKAILFNLLEEQLNAYRQSRILRIAFAAGVVLGVATLATPVGGIVLGFSSAGAVFQFTLQKRNENSFSKQVGIFKQNALKPPPAPKKALSHGRVHPFHTNYDHLRVRYE